MSKEIDRRVANNIEKADVDVVGILLTAQRLGANQLSTFCLHFISTNFTPMQKRAEWRQLGVQRAFCACRMSNVTYDGTLASRDSLSFFLPLSFLQPANLDHVTRHQWPPLSYLQDVEAYQAKFAKNRGKIANASSNQNADCSIM